MPEQDNWKEKYKSFVEDAREYGAFPQPLVEHVEDFIEKTLSSQAHALKERIEKEFENFNLCDWSGEGEVYSEIERLKLDVLSAIESIEI